MIAAMLAKGALLGVAVGVAFSMHAEPSPEPAAASTPYVEQLAAGLDCWGNDGATHPVPTRVIYHRGGDWQVGGRRVVGQALEQIFDGVDHQLVIYKFCVTLTTHREGARQ